MRRGRLSRPSGRAIRAAHAAASARLRASFSASTGSITTNARIAVSSASTRIRRTKILKALRRGLLHEFPRILRSPASPRGRRPGITAAPLELLEELIACATARRETGDWLDVGGGLGTVADLVRRRRPGWAVTLNEFNPRSLELARRNLRPRRRQQRCSANFAMPRRFDVISAISVLEHVPRSALVSALLRSSC